MNNSDDSKYVATRDRDFNLMYKMVRVNSADIDTATYQRKLDKNKVRRIAAEFDERIANEPKLSYRDGKYYVFDGQHTIAARKSLNNELDVDIICKVYFDMTPEEEAMLFAAQTGISSKPTPGVTLKAKSMGRDNETLAFIKANAAFDIQPSYSDVKGKCRLRCINTAMREFVKLGEKKYKEALKIIVGAWKGVPQSLVSDVIVAVCSFVSIYFGEYDRRKLILKLSHTDPYDIVCISRTYGDGGGKKKALHRIVNVYNNENEADPLPVKF